MKISLTTLKKDVYLQKNYTNMELSKKHKSLKDMTQLLVTLSLLVAEGITLSDEQILAIRRILWGALNPGFPAGPEPMANSHSGEESQELIYAVSGLAKFLGTSVSTAQKRINEGRFDDARVDFGGRKLVWNKAKLMEIAQKENK